MLGENARGFHEKGAKARPSYTLFTYPTPHPTPYPSPETISRNRISEVSV